MPITALITVHNCSSCSNNKATLDSSRKFLLSCKDKLKQAEENRSSGRHTSVYFERHFGVFSAVNLYTKLKHNKKTQLQMKLETLLLHHQLHWAQRLFSRHLSTAAVLWPRTSARVTLSLTGEWRLQAPITHLFPLFMFTYLFFFQNSHFQISN